MLPEANVMRISRNIVTNAVLTFESELVVLRLVALHAGRDWKFIEAFSLSLACDDQDDLDRVLECLHEDSGQELACRWFKDKVLMHWQIVSAQLDEWLASILFQSTWRMLTTPYRMRKLDIAKLQEACEGTAKELRHGSDN